MLVDHNHGALGVGIENRVPPSAAVKRFPGVIGTFMGRDALTLAIAHMGVGSGDTVLLPVYTCQEVLRSFVSRMDVVFYDVRPDLVVDPDEIRRKLNGRRAKAALITNYFGFLQPYRNELKAICSERGVGLIEDCAHSLLTEGSGETGDLATYSFRKILPVPDGGGLRVNDRSAPPAPSFHSRIYSDVLSAAASVKSMLKLNSTTLSRSNITSHTGRVLPKISHAAPSKRVLPLSHFAQSGMADLSFPDIVKKRTESFRFWQDLSAKAGSITPVFDALLPGTCPLGFPVMVRDRATLESSARKMGVPLSVHWRLDATLGTDCPTSHRLSAEMLTLPLCPDVSEAQRDVLARLVIQGWQHGHA
ncbi:MAG TPA: DegT/DnrJ/EryC1/StrS family aminotransferase [Bryobacteraceae bacterium]|nr:DegT/DnrJ/EryC1/StrS family aminotransferase [Bryobacteraceae bacterium]